MKWQRTKRQTLKITKPLSMFTNTYYITSGKANQIKETEDSALQHDTAPIQSYDMSIPNTTKFQGIHCVDGELLAIGKDYDPKPIIDNQLIIPLNTDPVTLNTSTYKSPF
jgi:hypothetical protein